MALLLCAYTLLNPVSFLFQYEEILGSEKCISLFNHTAFDGGAENGYPDFTNDQIHPYSFLL